MKEMVEPGEKVLKAERDSEHAVGRPTVEKTSRKEDV